MPILNEEFGNELMSSILQTPDMTLIRENIIKGF
jgi:hypothetical protein